MPIIEAQGQALTDEIEALEVALKNLQEKFLRPAREHKSIDDILFTSKRNTDQRSELINKRTAIRHVLYKTQTHEQLNARLNELNQALAEVPNLNWEAETNEMLRVKCNLAGPPTNFDKTLEKHSFFNTEMSLRNEVSDIESYIYQENEIKEHQRKKTKLFLGIGIIVAFLITSFLVKE